ncbi:alpha/beta hydrolase [Actinospica durhamensis]|uniref:Alpha/beta hydrolase n=1 Tax=Actinospica durhamensis TaxID=1508375 RepID=A0A941EXF6_9ACTN|nr:alpha/beta hydrolase [Actinospica durhamensis]MBR7838173.1 alpha/beta hydrolase [Actinospica durhamensis]
MNVAPRVPGRLVRVAGLATHVVAEPGPPGATLPPVLLSSGLGGGWFDWKLVLPELAERAPALCFDRPGLGWSEPSPVGPTLAGEADRIRALLTTPGVLGPGAGPIGPAVVVGFSLSGFHVEAFARMYPELVAGLVLIDGSAEPDAPAPPSPEQAERAVALWQKVGELAGRTGLAALGTPLMRALSVRATRVGGSDLADTAEVAAAGASGRVFTAGLLENATYHTLAAQLLELRCERPFPADVPLRVIAAYGLSPVARALPFAGGSLRRGREQWRARQQQLTRMSARGKLIELEDSAHFVPYDRPDAIVEAVAEVWSALV